MSDSEQPQPRSRIVERDRLHNPIKIPSQLKERNIIHDIHNSVSVVNSIFSQFKWSRITVFLNGNIDNVWRQAWHLIENVDNNQLVFRIRTNGTSINEHLPENTNSRRDMSTPIDFYINNSKDESHVQRCARYIIDNIEFPSYIRSLFVFPGRECITRPRIDGKSYTHRIDL